MKALPIGIQDFEKLRTDNYLYVDKTQIYFNLFKQGTFYFLSRPRRFGKSMMLSTLKYLYQGKKELFEGLWIEDKWDWDKVYPIIKIDLSEINTRNGRLEDGLMTQIQEHADYYAVKLKSTDAASCFRELIHHLGAGQNKCVVLVDEYDKPITDYIHEPQISEKHIKELKSFYGILKGADHYLHKVVITGVSKYGKVSIFSDLNNLSELSIMSEASLVCGYSQSELEYYFDEYIQKTAIHFEVSKERLLEKIQFWYNGFVFDSKMSDKLYNPFSMLNFFNQRSFRNYWYATGTPTFLAELIVKDDFRPENLEYLKSTELLFQSADIQNLDALSLLYQTGYLTIKAVQRVDMTEIFTLGYPNQEVRESFVTYLMAEYMKDTPSQISSELIVELKLGILDRNWDRVISVFKHVFATVPYHLFSKTEAYYHSLVHVTLTLSGYLVLSELLTNKGRIDSILETEDQVVIFEFKMDSSADIALVQIHEKKYPERYAKSGKELVLIGVNFDSELRNINEWKVEM